MPALSCGRSTSSSKESKVGIYCIVATTGGYLFYLIIQVVSEYSDTTTKCSEVLLSL